MRLVSNSAQSTLAWNATKDAVDNFFLWPVRERSKNKDQTRCHLQYIIFWWTVQNIPSETDKVRGSIQTRTQRFLGNKVLPSLRFCAFLVSIFNFPRLNDLYRRLEDAKKEHLYKIKHKKFYGGLLAKQNFHAYFPSKSSCGNFRRCAKYYVDGCIELASS